MKLWSILGVITLLFSFGCASTKVLKPLDPIDLSVLIAAMQDNNRPYQYFSAKGRVKMNGEEFKIGGRCNIRMIRDSLIWMNFKKFSVEAARVLIKRDSFWIIYPLENYYESGQTTTFFNDYNVDFTFSELQDFIVGNIDIPQQNQVRKYETDVYRKLDVEDQGLRYQYQITAEQRIYRMMITDTIERMLVVTYSDYNDDNFAVSREVVIRTPEEGESVFSLTLSKIEFDVPKVIKFEIPDHYTTY